jgi:hypothetical protein
MVVDSPSPRTLSRTEVRALWANTVNLIAFGILLWTTPGPQDYSDCDWYCGPAPYIVAILILPVMAVTWLVATGTTVEAFVYRHWVIASACAVAVLSPVVLFTVMILTAPLRAA